jgi:hypothetical protein
MKMINGLLPVLLASLAAACATSAPAPDGPRSLSRLGAAQAGPRGEILVRDAGAGFETAFTGAVLYATIDDCGVNDLVVEVGGQTTRLDLAAGAHTYLLYSGAPGRHIVRVTRSVDAGGGPTIIDQLRSDGQMSGSPRLS